LFPKDGSNNAMVLLLSEHNDWAARFGI